MADLSVIANEVGPLTDVVAANNTLLDRLADEIEASKDDPAAAQALADAVRTQRELLSAAVAAHTPADPNVPPA